jgi:glyoxylase-like metal-dependent hydrolase (beta-lactamase superfamily II)
LRTVCYISSMIVEHFPVAPLGCNCVILGDEEKQEAIVVDPGGEAPKILATLEAKGLRCVAIMHTHTHFDHVGAGAAVQEATGAPILLHEADLFLYEGLQMQLDAFGVPMRAPAVAPIDRFFVDGETISAGTLNAGVVHTPGHTPGSTCFVIGGDKPLLIAGDTLFRASIGRTDLWGGDGDQILRSIRDRLLTLPDETLVITGHGPTTTIAFEKRHNPFVGSRA